MDVSDEEYTAQKEKLGDEFFPDADSVLVGLAPPAKPEKVEKVVNQIKEAIEKRKGFSRRRAFDEDKDVDYINKRNKVFVEKVARAYDPYTVEIKQNLERGTAI